MAELRENTFVPCIDQASCTDLEGDVEALEAVALDGGGQLLVPVRLPLECGLN